MATLAVSRFHFCNVLEDIRMMSDNPHVFRFANLLEG
jgi:hypothetical protein